jgi:hypothetical protein
MNSPFLRRERGFSWAFADELPELSEGFSQTPSNFLAYLFVVNCNLGDSHAVVGNAGRQIVADFAELQERSQIML